ncbi:MAG: hypothetical protein ACE5IR_07645 [bacterium]
MKTAIRILCGYLLIVSQSYSQTGSQDIIFDRAQNSVGLSWGLHIYMSQDRIFSDQIYWGGSLVTGRVFYQRGNRNTVHRLDIGLSRINIRASKTFTYFVGGAPQPTQPSTASYIRVQYGYARRILHKQNFSLFVGGTFDNNFHFIEYHFGLDTNDGSLTSHALTTWLNAVYRFSKSKKMTVESTFAVIAWIGRSTFSATDEERLRASSEFLHILSNGKLAFPDKFTKLQFSITHSESIFSTTDFFVTYRFEYLKYPNPLEIHVLRNSIQIGFDFHF